MKRNNWQIVALYWAIVAILFAIRYIGSQREVSRFFGEFLISNF